MSLLFRRRSLLVPTEADNRFYLYNRGDSFIKFKKIFRTYNNTGDFYDGTPTGTNHELYPNNIVLTLKATGTYVGRNHCVSETKVDLTGYSKLCCSYQAEYSYAYIRLCLWNEVGTSLYDVSYIASSTEKQAANDLTGVLELSLADWQSEYHVGIFVNKGTNRAGVDAFAVDRIWLE